MEETMMKEIREHVESILKNHAGMKRQLKVLEYELDSLQKTLAPEIIEGKVFAHAGGERVSCSQPSDRTADIVIEHVDNQRDAKYHALKSVTYTMGLEVRRLEYYLSLLPKEESDVIRWLWFEGLSWSDITKKSLMSQSTLQRRKKQGFETLVGYYSLLDSLPAKADGLLAEARFISYLHAERYAQCLDRLKGTIRTPGIEAMMYLISGCNELWNTGIDTFFNFETLEAKQPEAAMESLSSQGAKLLRLACCYAQGFNPHNISQLLNSYFPGLEYVHLELAIESLRVAQAFTLNS
jgi:hypothetical protein